MESISESRMHRDDEMHTYFVTLKWWQKETSDRQSAMQRLFNGQNSSWIPLLFNLIKNKQRWEKGRGILHANWHGHWNNILCTDLLAWAELERNWSYCNRCSENYSQNKYMCVCVWLCACLQRSASHLKIFLLSPENLYFLTKNTKARSVCIKKQHISKQTN
mgnify:CR=1 FL=1